MPLSVENEIRQHWDRSKAYKEFDKGTQANKELQAAASAAVKGYGPGILRFLAHRMNDVHAASDAYSMFCLDMWQGIGKFEWRCKFRTWAYRLAVNASNRYRQGVNQPVRPLATNEISKVAEDVRTGVLTNLMRQELVSKIQEQLTPDERSLLRLKIEEDMTSEEIASILELPSGMAVRARLSRLIRIIQSSQALDASVA